MHRGRYYSPILLEIFQTYACSDVNIQTGALSNLSSINFKELQFLAKEGGLLDENLSLMQLIMMFTRVNAFAEQTGDDDEGGMGELNFTEFVSLLASIANAKYGSQSAGGSDGGEDAGKAGEAPAGAPAGDVAVQGSSFEETWRSFLGLLFVPRFKKLLKAKRQGTGRITVDGKSF